MPRWFEDRRSDLELVELCNSGGAKQAAAAFESLYRRHREYVLRVAMRFAGDRGIAEDALQETFSYLLNKFPPTGPGLRLSARLTTLLYPAAKNFAISGLRKSKRFEASEIAPDQLPAVPESTGEDLGRALAGLSAVHREVLTLRFVDELPLDEIAAALEIPPGTVKSRLHNAIKRLRADPELKKIFHE